MPQDLDVVGWFRKVSQIFTLSCMHRDKKNNEARVVTIYINGSPPDTLRAKDF